MASKPKYRAALDGETLAVNPSLEPYLGVRLRRKHQSNESLTLDTTKIPRLRALARLLLEGRGDELLSADLNEEVLRSLVAQGILLPETELPVPAEFRPTLDAGNPLLRDLLTSRSDEPTSITPGIKVGPKSTSAAHFAGVLEDSEATLYCVPQRHGNRLPIRLAPELERTWKQLERGDIAQADVPHDVRDTLAAGGFLRKVSSTSTCEPLGEHLREHQYVVVRGLLPPGAIAAYRAYCRDLREQGYLSRGDGQVEERWVQHNNPVFRALHRSIRPCVSAITEVGYDPCKESYCYFSTYERGAALARHRDRPQCRWNLSLVLDAEPDVPLGRLWPIYVETEHETVEVDLRPGDGLLYSGADLPHWREPLEGLDAVSCCFFHFVDLDFEDDLD